MIRKVSVPGKSLTGPVSLPASKSAAHRAILCASLAKGISHLSNFSFSQDMEATCRAVEALGVKTTLTGDTLTVDSRSLFAPSQAVLDCGESGSTLRFLIPTAAAGGVRAEFTGRAACRNALSASIWTACLRPASPAAPRAVFPCLSAALCSPVFSACPAISALNLLPVFCWLFPFSTAAAKSV